MYIYQITNNTNKKFYIGKTTKSIENRLKRHSYEVNYGSETYLRSTRISQRNFCPKTT